MDSDAPVKRPTVLLAEDDGSVAQALLRLLIFDFDVVAVVTSGEALIEWADQLRPDVVLADVGLMGLDGISATIEIRRRNPKIPVLLMTGSDVRSLQSTALAARASALLSKADTAAIVAFLHLLCAAHPM